MRQLVQYNQREDAKLLGMGALTSHFGRALRALREHAGMSQEALEERSGVSSVNVSKYERGRAVPNLRTLDALLDGLGCDLFNLAAAIDQIRGARPGEALEVAEKAQPYGTGQVIGLSPGDYGTVLSELAKMVGALRADLERLVKEREARTESRQ